MKYTYFDVNNHSYANNINSLFPDFAENEVLLVISPWDNDAVMGAGYAMLAAREAGAEVYVMIMCRGNSGYSTFEEKNMIEIARYNETIDCYARLGIAANHISRLYLPDFSSFESIGWQKANGELGAMPSILKFLREKKVTRMMVPNHYHESIDHLAAYLMSRFNTTQAGRPILIDHGNPHHIKSTLQYSVWADLDPEDAFINKRPSNMRANCIVMAEKEVEDKICDAMSAYVSQREIIKELLKSREERKMANGKFIEVYLAFPYRPKMDFSPYIKYAQKLLDANVNE